MDSPCLQCRQPFTVRVDDLAFYALVSPTFNDRTFSIPPPTLCPPCRRQRRLSWRNEKKLYRRTCALSGKSILSIYSPDKPFAVIDQELWMSDAVDPLAEGRAIDWNRPFIDQWNELHHRLPLPSMNMRYQNENSEYTNLSARNKNCYMIFAANDNESCAYCTYLHRSHNCMDCFFTFDSERCYECTDCSKCMSVVFSVDCQNCSDSALLTHCQGCRNCIACTNLKQKEYHILNRPCRKEECETLQQQILRDRSVREDLQTQARALAASLPVKSLIGFGNEHVSGDHILNCKNVCESYDVTGDEDCKHCVWFHSAKNCYDCYGWGLPAELCYENHLVGNNAYHVCFSESCWNDVSDLLYCRYCMENTHHCIGCIGLRHKENCILNVQYTKEEYEELAPRLIEKMRTEGLWGEWFPATLSPYGYNETVAMEYAPLTREEVRNGGWPANRSAAHDDDQTLLRAGWNWSDYESPPPVAERILEAADLPKTIDDVSDDILNAAIRCKETDSLFRITKHELTFYRDWGLPLPQLCFDERHRRRMALRNPRKLWARNCAKCGKEMETTYAPERLEVVYCEDCYLSSVY